MINAELSWQQAAAAGAGAGVVAAALAAARRPRLIAAALFARETALILGLFALWQYAGSFTVMGPGGALARSQRIWRFERALHLPGEAAIQRVFLPHPLLIQFFNLYYDVLHFAVLIGCLIWLFTRHRDAYRRTRTAVAAFTAVSLAIQLIPVAPPRMLASAGMTDTGVLYHQSVYSSAAGFNPDQLSAMPSVHVGWAILVAMAVITTLRSRWRWLAVLYPAMTTLAVIVTANHFWLDGIVAAAIVAAVHAAQCAGRRLLAARRTAATPVVAVTTASRRPAEAQPVPAGSADSGTDPDAELALAGQHTGVPELAVSSANSPLRRLVTGPGSPPPTGRPSTASTGVRPPIVPVTNISSAA